MLFKLILKELKIKLIKPLRWQLKEPAISPCDRCVAPKRLFFPFTATKENTIVLNKNLIDHEISGLSININLVNP